MLLLKKYENYLPHFIQLLNKHKNSKIVVFGMGFSAPIADYISQRLTLNGFLYHECCSYGNVEC